VILIDSGVMVALMLQTDPAHSAVRAFLRDNHEPLALPTVTVAEIAHFVESRGGPAADARLLRVLASGRFPLSEPLLPDYARAAELVEQYADFPLGTVDALIIAMAERLNVTTILTLDRRHFGAIQPAHCEKLTLAP
jgi:uncharacterized protein